MRLLLKFGYIALPLAFVVHLLLPAHGPVALRSWEPVLTFLLSGIAIIPLAQLMGEATGQLSIRTGPTLGGLLNATFGNAAELIIAIIALTKGLKDPSKSLLMNDIIKASLTGSILGNLLLVSGGAMLAGGWKRERQNFSRDSAQTNSSMLAVAVAAMLFPAIFHFTYGHTDQHLTEHENGVSVGASLVLLTVYVLGLFFTLKTHHHLFSSAPAESPEEPMGIASWETWSVKKSVLTLLLASVLTAIVAELLVGTVEAVGESLHWNRIFVGVILLAIFGNAAEQSTAIILARRGDMETAMTITYQSSLQIALFTTPFLVLLSAVITSLSHGQAHVLDLIFSPMEVAAVLLTVAVVTVVGLNGETNWFEGVMLLAVYAILGITFFYIPTARPDGYDITTTGPGGGRVPVELRGR
jgi:Ca2+:H+ antiporter